MSTSTCQILGVDVKEVNDLLQKLGPVDETCPLPVPGTLVGGAPPIFQTISSLLLFILFGYLSITKNNPGSNLVDIGENVVSTIAATDYPTFFDYLFTFKVECLTSNELIKSLTDSCAQLLQDTTVTEALTYLKDALSNPATFVTLFTLLTQLIRLILQYKRISKGAEYSLTIMKDLLNKATGVVIITKQTALPIVASTPLLLTDKPAKEIAYYDEKLAAYLDDKIHQQASQTDKDLLPPNISSSNISSSNISLPNFLSVTPGTSRASTPVPENLLNSGGGSKRRTKRLRRIKLKKKYLKSRRVN